MRVFVEEAPGQVTTVEVNLSDKIKAVKSQILKKRGHPVARQQLFKGGTELGDTSTVNDCKLRKDAKLTLRLVEKGNLHYTSSPGKALRYIYYRLYNGLQHVQNGFFSLVCLV